MSDPPSPRVRRGKHGRQSDESRSEAARAANEFQSRKGISEIEGKAAR